MSWGQPAVILEGNAPGYAGQGGSYGGLVLLPAARHEERADNQLVHDILSRCLQTFRTRGTSGQEAPAPARR